MATHCRTTDIALLPGLFRAARVLSQDHGIGVDGDFQQDATELLRSERIVGLPGERDNGGHHPCVLRLDFAP